MTPLFLSPAVLALVFLVVRPISALRNAPSVLLEHLSFSSESHEASQMQRLTRDLHTTQSVSQRHGQTTSDTAKAGAQHWQSWYKRTKLAPDSSYIGYPAVSTEIAWTGRTRKDTREGSVSFDWSGTKMSFSVIGNPSEVWIQMDGQSNYFNAYFDGEIIASFYAKSGTRYYLVAKDVIRDGRIDLVKRSEAKNSWASWVLTPTAPKVLNVVLPPACQLAKPNITNIRTIEFIGDGDSAGFGNLAPRTSFSLRGILDLNFKNEDVTKSWGALVSRAFHADMHSIAISGIGAQWDVLGNERNNMRKFYNRMLYAEDKVVKALDRVDLVVVDLGKNDLNVISSNESKAPEFVAGYAKLLEMVMALRPGTPVLCIGPRALISASSEKMVVSKKRYDLLNRLIPEAVSKAGSKDIEFKEFFVEVNLDDDSQWGALDHLSVNGHVHIARGAINIISKLMGWEPTSGWEDVSHSDDLYSKLGSKI